MSHPEASNPIGQIMSRMMKEHPELDEDNAGDIFKLYERDFMLAAAELAQGKDAQQLRDEISDKLLHALAVVRTLSATLGSFKL